MKIRALKPFAGPNGFVEVGQVVEVNNELGRDICAKGYAEEVREEPKAGHGPTFQHRIAVSKTRNLTVEVWPPREGSEFDTPSISLVEGRRENNEWKNTRIYLSWGSLLELAETLREAWHEMRR